MDKRETEARDIFTLLVLVILSIIGFVLTRW